uniref:Uncharacterized protein n=1 Tax=Magallana gigas TaxID=29159 RepID=A0A8W8NC35_MAGGI
MKIRKYELFCEENKVGVIKEEAEVYEKVRRAMVTEDVTEKKGGLVFGLTFVSEEEPKLPARRLTELKKEDFEKLRGCVSSLMNRLKWEPLKDRRCKDRLTMAYKIRNRLVDIDPSNYYKPGDSRTRGGHRIYQQRTRKDQYRFSFFPRSTREWNTLPEKATTAATLEEFKASLTILPEALTGASHT